MEIGSRITSSFSTGYGTAGLYLAGTLFGQNRVALLTNSHVIGSERNHGAKATWEALVKVWAGLYPQQAPGARKKALSRKLWDLQHAGGLVANPPLSVLRADAGVAPVFGGNALSMLDLYGTISEAGGGIVADALYQTEIGNDFAIAVLRTGVVFENLAPSQAGKQAIAGTADPVKDSTVFKAGATTGVTSGVVKSIQGTYFVVQKDPGDFSDKGDSGSAIFNAAHAWVGLIYADALGTGKRLTDGTKCILHSTVLSALKKLYEDDLAPAPSNGIAP